MARLGTAAIEEYVPPTDLALYEDVNMDEHRKQFYSKVDDEHFLKKTAEEVKADVERADAEFDVWFFGVDDELGSVAASGDYDEVTKELAERMDAYAEELAETSETFRAEILENQASNFGTVQVEPIDPDEDDPLGAEKFESAVTRRKSSYLDQKNRQVVEYGEIGDTEFEQKRRSERLFGSSYEEEKTDSYSYGKSSSKSSYSKESSSYSSDAGSSYSARKDTKRDNNVIDLEEKAREKQKMYYTSADKVKEATVRHDAAKAARYHQKIDAERKARRGQEKGIKGMWKKTKRWVKSHEAADLLKVGMMIALETGLAIITKKYQFEGSNQMLGFVGLMMGTHFLGKKLNQIGYDPRIIRF